MKNLLDVKGAKALTKKEQKTINGGLSAGVCTDAAQISCNADGGWWEQLPPYRPCDGRCYCSNGHADR